MGRPQNIQSDHCWTSYPLQSRLQTKIRIFEAAAKETQQRSKQVRNQGKVFKVIFEIPSHY